MSHFTNVHIIAQGNYLNINSKTFLYGPVHHYIQKEQLINYWNTPVGVQPRFSSKRPAFTRTL